MTWHFLFCSITQRFFFVLEYNYKVKLSIFAKEERVLDKINTLINPFPKDK